MVRVGALALVLCFMLPTSWAARIVQFSPQGEVAVAKGVEVSFDVPVVAFGNGQATGAPVDVACNDPSVKGEGRWLDAKRWTYVFESAPGPGIECSARVRPSFRTLSNEALEGRSSFAFATGGPQLVWSLPRESTIDEEQAFVLRFNGAVATDTLLANTTCLVEGLGEAVPVRLISAEARTKVLEAASVEKGERDAATQVIQCKRRLPADAKVRLSVGPGVASVSGVAARNAELFEYEVRPPFNASFSCQRENAHAACTPMLPVTVTFSAPISRADAERIRLETPTGPRSPTKEDDSAFPNSITYLRFDGLFPELADLTVVLPDDLKDDAGRALGNAGQFPLTIRTAAYPALVKFAKAPFGIIERFAYQPADGTEADYPPSVPLTVRNVETDLGAKALLVSPGKVRDHIVRDDVDVLHWYARLRRLDEGSRTRAQLDAIMQDQSTLPDTGKQKTIDPRGFSALKGQANVRQLTLPAAGASDGAKLRPFEVIGVPLPEPGFHVLEVESARLGASLLASQAPMYVRSSALVTNLGVHIKRGRDDVLAWVTTLDDGRVVPNASIAVLSCEGRLLASGKTDARGIWHHRKQLESPDYCDNGLSGIYVSARIAADHAASRGKADFAFVFSDWDQGIEPWRFNVPTDSNPRPTTVAHTVFDRTLLRAGEVVSMKHFVRIETRDGLALPDAGSQLPETVMIRHEGSGQRYELPVKWDATPSGGLSALSRYVIPVTAKLGTYSVELKNSKHDWFGSSSFRVEAFKLPVLTGSLKINDAVGAALLIAPAALTADVQVSYVSGGPAGKLPVELSGVVRDKWLNFAGYEGYSFNLPEEEKEEGAGRQSLFLNRKALVLDAQGGARLALDAIPKITRPQDLLFEAGFADPNGDIQTLSQVVSVWPASVLAGIRADSWVQMGKAVSIDTVALSPTGQPQANVAVTVVAQSKKVYSSRKRMVGGFYSYDNHTEVRDLGTVCEGSTDDRGAFSCSADLKHSGSIQLRATVEDPQGRASSALATVWVVGGADLWFGGADDDRIDIIPAKKAYRPGETASFQVRMPFREATALVAVEREGVLSSQVVTLKGNDPTVSIPIMAEWGPNVYVSVLVLRGRMHDVPWYSFFAWGWRQPAAWYEAFTSAAKAYAAPTPFVDLSKPAFRFGLTEIQVSDTQDQLVVKVTADKKVAQVRGKAIVTIQVSTPDGEPAAHGQVAFAAVDQALLELSPNNSWDVLGAMRQRRSYGVATATAQMQIVGRRHYGRKALPAGGGGGKSPTRELLDTLLVWQPMLQLDENGKAQITVPLNDSITRFRLVAVADHGTSRFGTGSTDIAVTQDLQIIPGLPLVVREGDRYQAMATVRNSTQRDMQVQVVASYRGAGVQGAALVPTTVRVGAGSAQLVMWEVKAPDGDGSAGSSRLEWLLEAREQATATATATDRLTLTQSLIPVVPVTASQATLLAVESGRPPVKVPIAVPKGALADSGGRARGGIEVILQSSLAGGLPGVKQWFNDYAYTCLEQLASKAIGLRSLEQWQAVMRQLPDYLDADGLAGYFPGARQGSEVLTAYLLTASHQAQALGLPFALPVAVKSTMTRGLLAFAQGKIERHRWAAQKDLDTRKLLVLEALSREGLVKPRMLGSITIAPDRWPTSAVIDWLALLQRVPGIANQAQRLEQTRQIIQARLLSRGTELAFANDAQNNWWWLMLSPEVNAAKLILTVAGRPEWDAELPRLAQGLIRLQHNGAWRTTTANLMASLALERFGQQYEGAPVAGQVKVSLESTGKPQVFKWAAAPAVDGVRTHRFFYPWPDAQSDALVIEQEGQGRSWVSMRAMAAEPTAKPVSAGYRVTREITPIMQAVAGRWSRGDVYRVSIGIVSETPSVWAVLTDPLPSGATILGSGLGRDSALASNEEKGDYEVQPRFVERKADSYRAYYEFLPQGTTRIDYTVRLNTVGEFELPPTRIEAMYQPDVYGVLPILDGMTVRVAGEQG